MSAETPLKVEQSKVLKSLTAEGEKKKTRIGIMILLKRVRICFGLGLSLLTRFQEH